LEPHVEPLPGLERTYTTALTERRSLDERLGSLAEELKTSPIEPRRKEADTEQLKAGLAAEQDRAGRAEASAGRCVSAAAALVDGPFI
jgi:hypothetical protein